MDTAVEDIGITLDIFSFVLFILVTLGAVAATKQVQLLDGFVGITGLGCNLIGIAF